MNLLPSPTETASGSEPVWSRRGGHQVVHGGGQPSPPARRAPGRRRTPLYPSRFWVGRSHARRAALLKSARAVHVLVGGSHRLAGLVAHVGAAALAGDDQGVLFEDPQGLLNGRQPCDPEVGGELVLGRQAMRTWPQDFGEDGCSQPRGDLLVGRAGIAIVEPAVLRGGVDRASLVGDAVAAVQSHDTLPSSLCG